MNNNQGNTAPQGEMVGDFTQPDMGGTQKTKRTGIKKIPVGINPGVVFAIVDLGTHSESYQGKPPIDKRKIFIGIEFPQYQQLFYEEDTDTRSSAAFTEMTFFTGDRAKLRQIITAYYGRDVTDKEAAEFPISKAMGLRLLCNISHKTAKSSGNVYEKVENFIAIGSYALPTNFDPSNDKWLFYLDKDGKNFMSSAYANLPGFLKKKILASKEAVAYAQRGGTFAERPKEDNSQPRNAQQGDMQQSSAAPQQSSHDNVEMIATDYTLDQYLQANWTINQLVEAGKARIKQAAPAAPSGPQGPGGPQGAPAPQGPAAPQQQAQQESFNNPQQQQAQKSSGNEFEDETDDLPF